MEPNYWSPANGRALTETSLDEFLAILTNGRVTSVRVGPHQDLLSEFPYLEDQEALIGTAETGPKLYHVFNAATKCENSLFPKARGDQRLGRRAARRLAL